MRLRRRLQSVPPVEVIEYHTIGLFGHELIALDVRRGRERWHIGAAEPHRWAERLPELREQAEACAAALRDG